MGEREVIPTKGDLNGPLPKSQLDMAKLAQKIQRVMKDVDRIPKNGYNEHFKYKFANESDVLDAVRSACVEHGLILLTDMVDVIQEPSGAKSGKGADIIRTRVTLVVEIIDTETGYSICRRWNGESVEAEDKGIQKAGTSAMKYFLLKCFLIPTGDDPDAAAPAQTAKPKAATPANPADPKIDPRQAIANQIVHECALLPEQCDALKAICKAKSAKLSDMLIKAKDAGCKDFFDIRAYIEDGALPA